MPLAIQAGDHVSIAASGTIGINMPIGGPEYKESSPAGYNVCGTGFPFDQFFCYGLVGRLEGQAPFYIGFAVSFVAQTSGTLVLYVNDDNLADNSGAWTVAIDVAR